MARKPKVVIKACSATFKNLNFKPEKHGPEELVERSDISVQFHLQGREIAQLLKARKSVLSVLWDGPEELMFKDVSNLPIDIIAEGDFKIGIDRKKMLKFKDAKLKKVVLTPLMNQQATVNCQVRVDPTNNMDNLAQFCVSQEVFIEFDGVGGEKSPQGDLNV